MNKLNSLFSLKPAEVVQGKSQGQTEQLGPLWQSHIW